MLFVAGGSDGAAGLTDIDAPPLASPLDQVLYPVDVVEPQRYGGDQPLQGDLNGQPEILLEKSAGQGPHCLWVLEIQTGERKTASSLHELNRQG